MLRKRTAGANCTKEQVRRSHQSRACDILDSNGLSAALDRHAVVEAAVIGVETAHGGEWIETKAEADIL